MRADVCLSPACRWMLFREETDPPAERCPRCGGPLLWPRRQPTLVEMARRFDPLEDA